MKSQINNRYAPTVQSQTTGITMNQSQFDALTSLCYNTGGGNPIIANSPLVKYLKGTLTESQARAEYAEYYITSGGQILQGLINRRNAEAELFFSETDSGDSTLPLSAESASFVSRSDGVWYWPLPQTYYNAFSDWAGCPGQGSCPFCGVVHSGWGDNWHTDQAYGHNGFDVGTGGNYCNIYAAASGTAYCSSKSANGGRGYYIVIEHPLGNGWSYYSYYQHMNDFSVSNGATVSAGQVIGQVGCTGGDYGVHLHFGIILAESNRGQAFTNSSTLYNVEVKGWVLTPGMKEGRILVNPALNSPAGFPTGSSEVVPPLRAHAGSVMFTFNQSQVAIGETVTNYDISISGATQPSSITYLSMFGVYGIVTSGAPLTNVTAAVYDVNGSMQTGKSATPNSTTYNLENLDPYVLFDTLSPGVYHYKVTASNAENTVTLVNKVFTVLATSNSISDGYYTVKTRFNPNLSLEAVDHGTALGTGITLSNELDCDNQLVYIASAGNGYYSIRHVASGLYFDVADGAATNGTAIQLYPENTTDAQRWQILPAGQSYCLVPKCAPAAALTAVNGVAATLNQVNLTEAQRFTLSPGCLHAYTYSVQAAPTTAVEGELIGTCSICGATTTVSIQPLNKTAYSYEVIEPASCSSFATARYTWNITDYGTFYFDVPDVEYSDWSTEYPTGVDASLIESAMQHRYAEHEAAESYDSTMDGWTPSGSRWEETETGIINYVASWPQGYPTDDSLYQQYNNSPKIATEIGTDSDTITEKTEIDSENTIGYVYYHWCRGTPNDGQPDNRATNETPDSEFKQFHSFFSTSDAPYENPAGRNGYPSKYLPNAAVCRVSYWFYPLTVTAQNYTMFRKLFTFERWSDWSDWRMGEAFSDSNRRVETRTVYRYVTSTLGVHTWGAGVVTTPATCTAEGVRTFTCTVCGETQTEAIAKTPHAYDAAVTPPTCAAQGFTTHTCSVCGDSYVDTYVPATDHNYSYTVATTPTASATGSLTGACANCSATTSVPLPALNTTDYTYEVIQQATTTTEGTGRYTWKTTTYGTFWFDVSIPVTADPNAASILVSSASGLAGSTVTVELSLSHNPGIVSVYLDLSYDTSKLTLTGVEDTGLLTGALFGNDLTAVPFALNWDDSLATENNTSDGVFARLTFRINDDCPEGSIPITVTYDDGNIIDKDLDDVSFQTVSGAVVVVDYTLGDVDGDGKVLAKDVAVLRRYLAHWSGVTIVEPAADVNKDGRVTAGDVAVLRRYLAHWSGVTLSAVTAPKTESRSAPHRGVNVPMITVSSIEGTVGEQVTLDVDLLNNPGIVSAYLDLSYDNTKLRLVSVEDTKLLNGALFSNDYSIIPFALNWDDSIASANNTQSGTIARLTFEILEGCQASPATVSISYVPGNILNYDLDEVDFALTEGTVTAAAAAPKVTHSLSLKDEIDVNFYMDLPESCTAANTTVSFAWGEGKTALGTLAEATGDAAAQGYTRVVQCPVPARSMTDKITLTVKQGDTVLLTNEYCIADYCADAAEHFYNDDHLLNTLCDMLDYGGLVQREFGYQQSDLADARIAGLITAVNAKREAAGLAAYAWERTALPAATIDDPDTNVDTVDFTGYGIRFYAASLTATAKTAIRLYFTVDDDAAFAATKVYLGEAELDFTAKNGRYYVEISGIDAKNIFDTVTLRFENGASSLTVRYNAIHYLNAVLASTDAKYDNLKLVMQAMYNYWNSAKTYFQNANS